MSDATTSFGATWLIQSTALLVVGLIAGRLLRRRGPALQSAAYRATLAAVLVSPAATALLGAMGVRGFSLRPAEAPAPVGPHGSSAFVPAPPGTDSEKVYDNVKFEITFIESGSPTDIVARAEEVPPTHPIPWGAVGGWTWALGTIWLLVRMAVQQIRVARLRATAADVDPETRSLGDALAREMGVNPPRLGRSPFVPGPCLDGLMRPMILLPEEVDGDDRDAIAHELAHLARRDAWWNLARRLASALLWPQPLAWLLSRRLEATAEEVCDDVVVSLGADRPRYAGLLVATAGRGVPALAPAAVGMVSLRSALARRVARILDDSRPLSTRAGRRAVAAIFAVGLAATAVAGLIGVGRKAEAGPREPAAAVAPATPPVAEPGAVAGWVVDEAGAPVARATVAAWRPVFVDEALQAVPREVARTATDDDGRFRLPAEAAADGAHVAFHAPGFHAAIVGRERLLAADPIRLWRGEPTAIEGQVVGPDERPLAGALVEVRIAHPVDPTKPTGTHPKMVLGGFGVPGSILPVGPATTDVEGRFRIVGLCRGDGAELRITRPEIPERVRAQVRKLDLGPDVAVRDTDVVLLGPGDRIELPSARFRTSTHDGRAHGLPIRVVMEPARAVEGVVRDAKTGQAVAGALVDVSGGAGSEPPTLVGTFVATTDARGHYRIAGLPGGRATPHALAVYPPTDRPHLAVRSVNVPWREVGETTLLDVALPLGVMIEGRVLDERGAPVEAVVDYYPALANRHAEGLTGDDRNTQGVPWGHRHRTDAEGRFRVPGLPGGGVVGVRAAELYKFRAGLGAGGLETTNEGKSLAVYGQVRPLDFNALKAVDVPEDVATFAAGEIRVDRGRGVTLRVVDEAGEPAIGALVGGTSPQRPGMALAPMVEATGEVAVQALAHGERRAIRIYHRGRKLGAFLALSAEDVPEGRPLVVTIRPFGSVSGRFVDGWGEPVSGNMSLAVNTFDMDVPSLGMSFWDADVDAQGRFRIDDLLPGEGFGLLNPPSHRTSGKNPPQDVFPQHRLRRGFPSLTIGAVKIEPGRTTDLGTIDVDSGRRVDGPGPVQAPPPKPQARSVRAEGPEAR